MFLLYLDATGSADLRDVNTTHYVLAGVCVAKKGGRAALEAALKAVADRWRLDDPVELHAKDIRLDIREQGKVPDFAGLERRARRDAVWAVMEAKLARLQGLERRQYQVYMRAKRPILHLARRECSQVYEQALDAIGAQDGLTIFFDAVEKRHAVKVHGLGMPTPEVAFRHLVGRFVGFLSRQTHQQEKLVRGRLVMDNDPKDEALFQDLYTTCCRLGHELGQVDGVIKKPTFVDSKKSVSIQAADLVAYAARRYIERWDKRDAQGVCHEEKQFRRILTKLDRHGGHLHGARHLIDSRRCGCLICQERGYADAPA